MLKNWAVRQLASALSDYVEGISTETVQASLGRDIGRLNLTGARVNPQAVEQYGLEVLRSELSIDAEVPWRHLSSQPTTLTVCSLRLELRLSRRKDATQNSSEAKEEQVKKLEDELMASAEEAQEGGGFVFGRVARLSHAILRQLRVSIGRLEAVVHHQQPGKSPVTIALGESGLESVGPDWQSLPTDETDLRKVLRLSGFEAKLGGRDLRLFGPLAVQARLLHSPEQALVKLWLELPQEADTAFQISPEALQELRSWFDWVVAEFLQDSGQGRELSEAAGLRYAAVYGSKLKGEPFDEELLAKLEATASVKWLAQWRCQSRLEGGEAEAADGHGPERVESQWRSWLHWAKGDTETKETKETKEPKEKETKEKETKEKETKDQIPPKEAWPEDSDLHFSAALLDEVVTEELPELSTPTRFEVDMLISQYTALCAASGGLLKASVGGAAFSLDVATASGSESARKLCLTVKLASMSISLDDQPLVQLLERAGAERASFERQASHDRRLSPGAGLQFQVHADQRPSSPLDVAVTLLGEPVQVELAPMTLHGTLRSIQDAVNAWRSPMSLAPEEEEVSEPEGPDRPDVEESQAVKHAKAAASVAGLDAIHLSLSVEVEAPILRLQTWHDGSALELHLGCFSAKTLQQDRLQFSESEGLSMLLQEAQSIDPRAFAVICELRDTRIKVMELGERDRFAYEPSTIVLGAALTGAGRQIHAEASRMRCHIDPGLLHLIGQLQVGLDFALAPLSGNVRAPPSVQRTTSRRRRASIKPEGPPLKFNLRTGSFDVIWDPCGGGGFHDSSVKGRIAGVSLKVETGLRTSVVGNAQDAHMDCGDQRFVSIIGNLDVQADWSQQAVKLVLVAPPVELRWSAASVRKALLAGATVQREVQVGQSEALQRCPQQESDLGMTKALWERFVAERTEELRGALEEAIREFQEPTGLPRTIQVTIQSRELRAVLLRPSGDAGQTVEVQATMRGLECDVQRGEGLLVRTTLTSLEVWLCERLLLAPRQADLPLLQAQLTRGPQGTSQSQAYDLHVAWAQIALVYRQRDFERIAGLCHEEVTSAAKHTHSEPKSEAVSSQDALPEVAQGSQESEKARKFQLAYCFDIDAPLLFLPASSGKKCDADRSSTGGLSTDADAVQSSQRNFHPLPDEGFLVLDLGNCLVESDLANAGSVKISMKRLQVFFAASSDQDPAQTWHQVLRPATADVEVHGSKDSLDIHVIAPLSLLERATSDRSCHSISDVSPIACGDPLTGEYRTPPHFRLTRGHATQFFDVLYLNFSYASADEVDALREALKVRLQQQLEELPVSGRGFSFTLEWTGALLVEAGFTHTTPLARLEIMNGRFQYRRPTSQGEAVSRYIDFSCQGGCVKDTRDFQGSKLGMLIDLPNQEKPGLEVATIMPPEQTDPMQLTVELRQPNVWLLPQLWMDLLTWALSIYQQTAQANAVEGSVSEEVSRTQQMKVIVSDGAVRLPIAWAAPAEHFALMGDVILSINTEGSKMCFDPISLPNASLIRVSVSDSLSNCHNRLLCEKVVFFAKVISEKQVAAGTRISMYCAELVKLQRFQVRITLQDVLELSDMLQAMALMEAESVEPQEEIRSRDPLSLVQPQKMSVATSVELDGMDLQVMAPRPVLEFALGCPLTQVHLSWVRGETPMGSVRLERFWLRLKALNERLAAWEPILGDAVWNLDFLCRRTRDRPEAVAEVYAAPVSAIQVAVTVPVIRACARLLQSYGDAVDAAQEAKERRKPQPSARAETTVKKFEDEVVGINLTGLRCIASKVADLDSFLSADRGSAFTTCLGSKPVGLDRLVDANRKLKIQLLGLEGCPIKSISVRAGATEFWNTSGGRLLVQVMVPRPPQMLVLITSPLVLVNRTLLDLEVKLLGVPNLAVEASLWPPFCMPSQLLDARNGSQLEASASAESWTAESSEYVNSHTLLLPSNFILAIPPQALRPEACFQLRPCPSSVGGMNFSFGAPVHPTAVLQMEDVYAVYSRSACSEVSMPAHGLRLTVEERLDMCKLEIQAPFSLCNATPVELCCHLCWSNDGSWEPQKLEDRKDRCDAQETLHICDGYGGVWDVPENGFAYVAPLRSQGSFQWWTSSKKERQDCHRSTNFLQVKRDGQRIFWQFCQARRGLSSHRPLRLAPGDEVPIYELPEQFGSAPSGGVLRQSLHRNERSLPPLLLSVALSDRSGRMSAWSPPTPVLVDGQMVPVPMDLSPLWLRCARQTGQCKAKIYGNCWFNDATGLDVVLIRHKEVAPVYNNLAVIDDEAWGGGEDEASPFQVVLNRTCQPVPLPFVNLGQSAKVRLSEIHDCILRSEPISASSSHGVSSTLLTLMPALLAFNRLDCEVGVRQEGTARVIWLEAQTGCSAIYWVQERPRRLQAAVRKRGGREPDAWSASFDVSEHGIGCFPVRLQDAELKEFLLCLQVEQCSGQLMTLTAAGPSACHQLVNRHPCLVVDGSFVDSTMEFSSRFVAVHGAKVAFGFPGVLRFGMDRRVVLILGDISSRSSASVELQLGRPSNQVVEASHLQFPVAVRLDIVQRVAHITVSPVGFLVGFEGSDSLSWTFQMDVRIPALDVGIKASHSPFGETFRIHLKDLHLRINQSDGKRETVCELAGLQVDHDRKMPKKNGRIQTVVLASLDQGQPWRLRIQREKLNESDIILSSVSLQFFPSPATEGVVLECSASEELIREIKAFVQEATPPQLEGQCLFHVARTAGLPYHSLVTSVPRPERKYVLRNFQCSELKIGLWCSLTSASLPSYAVAMLTLSSFSHTLDIDGARVKLAGQSFFHAQPFEGTMEALANVIVERYKPCVAASWRSVVNNSNVVLGGLFSRHLWAPRQRSNTLPTQPLLSVRNGVVLFRSEKNERVNERATERLEDTVQVCKKATEAPLDEETFQQVLRSGDIRAIETFLRRLIAMIGARVGNEQQLTLYAKSLLGPKSARLDDVADYVSSGKCSWVAPS